MKNKVICRPKSITFIIMVALVLIFTILIVGTFGMIEKSDAKWYHFMMLGLFSLIDLVILLRIMFLYKIVQAERGVLSVSYPLRFGMKDSYDIKEEVLYWSFKELERGKRLYDYLEIQTKYGALVKLNSAELSHVKQLKNYLYSKHAKLMR